MKQGWKIKKLGEVCEVIAGQSPEGKFYNSDENGIPFYQGKKEFGKKYIGEPTTWTSKITKEAEADDILMSVRAPVGPVNFATQKICIGRGLAAIRVGNAIDRNFLFNFLLKHENEIIGNIGTVFDSINKIQIENIEIPLPPLPEQKRIVSILDKCFSAIDKAKTNAEQNLKNAKELFESYLQEVFSSAGSPIGKGWKVKKLRECFKLKSGDMLSAKMMEKGEIPVYGGNGISGYHNTYNLQGENIIVGRVGALCGNIRLVCEKIWLTDNAFLVTDYKFDFDKSFLTYLLNFKNLRSYARQAAQPVISNSSLNNVGISFPKLLKEQQRIVRQLDSLRSETQKLEAVYQKKIADLEELKKSILRKAFSGELR
jgi:type I restriction enzyme S subunit